MRVDKSTSSPIQGGEAKKAGKAQGAKGVEKSEKSGNVTEAHESSGGATAEVSSRAREMATAKTIATDAPDTREDKIADLKARIAAGKYNVDGKAVADRMVDEHIRMSGIG